MQAVRSKPISPLELRYKADQSQSGEADKLCVIKDSDLQDALKTRWRKRLSVGYNEARGVKGRKRQGLVGQVSGSRFRASNFCVAPVFLTMFDQLMGGAIFFPCRKFIVIMNRIYRHDGVYLPGRFV